MGAITRDFISDERRDYKFKLGRTLASALSGFIVGALTTGIIWYVTAMAEV